MVMEQIGNGVRTAKDTYTNNGLVKTGVNAGLLYGGSKLAGNVAAGMTGMKEIDDISDFVAPALSGLYAIKSANGMNTIPKNVVQLGIAAAIGWDMADTIMQYQGNGDAMNSIKADYQRAQEYVSKMYNNSNIVGESSIADKFANAKTALGTAVASAGMTVAKVGGGIGKLVNGYKRKG